MSEPTGAAPAATQQPAAAGIRTYPGQLRNLILATLASTVGFWAWTLIGPLSKHYVAAMHLGSEQIAFLVAMPIFVGSLARVPAGILTDKFGGRVMFTIVLGSAAVMAAVTGLVGTLNDFGALMVAAFFLGVAGSVFAVGIPFSSAWYDPKRKGFATGVFGAGMVGTAVSAFFTPRLVAAVGYLPTHLIVAGVAALFAVVCALFLRESPVFYTRTPQPAFPALRRAFTLPATYALCFMYAIVFGAFVAFSNYLPTYLSTVYGFNAEQAGTRVAGFALAAVIARPIGGIIADHVGPRLVTIVSLVGVIVFAEIVSFQPIQEVAYGGSFLAMALLLGLGTGGVFAWVGKVVPANSVGTVGGIIAAAGGLGGYFPPLVMGLTYDAQHHSYFVGLSLLSVFCVVSLLIASFFGRKAATERAVAAAKNAG
ncbi:MAG: MFS transporter [Microbacteriaceae bacterium]|nr:MFS transporter [Microbacteriaceae bacterium]MCL2794483.1 MFS transporter [Microbacteriaceae bacterium]